MSEVVDFLLARIAEDEAVAVAARALQDHGDDRWWVDGPAQHSRKWWVYATGEKFNHEQTATHIARHDPARVLAECDAKRDLVTGWSAFLGGAPEWAAVEMPSLLEMAQRSLRLLAVPYADHPDYDGAWRP